jgi:hypothetical protein
VYAVPHHEQRILVAAQVGERVRSASLQASVDPRSRSTPIDFTPKIVLQSNTSWFDIPPEGSAGGPGRTDALHLVVRAEAATTP